MQVLVVDSSLLISTMLPEGSKARNWLIASARGCELRVVQGLTRLELSSALRSLVRHGAVSVERAESVHRRLIELPLREAPVGQPLLNRVWELRNNLTAYDAAYVALTESLQARTGGKAALATADRRLANAPGVTCPVLLYAA
jgi:predicted nucleic acid-binding protein